MKIQKKENIKKVVTFVFEMVFIITLFVFLSQNILNAELADLDEMWNFSFAKNIADGKLPYKDFNMIVTPGVSIFASIFLKIIANEMIVYRALTIIFATLFMYLIYRVWKKLKINKFIAIALVFGLLQQTLVATRFDYNYMIIFIAVLMILLELKLYMQNRDKCDNYDLLMYNFKYDLLIGLTAGIGICTKQTIGLILAVACLIYKIVEIRSKEQLRDFVKIFLTRLIGILIPVLILLIYFACNGIFKDFLDYTLFGINGFTNKANYNGLFKMDNYYKVTAVIVPIILIYMFINSIIKFIIKDKLLNKSKYKYLDYSNIIFILFIYSVIAFVLIYPISDICHFTLAIIPTLIAGVYIVMKLLNKIIKVLEEKFKIKFFDNFNLIMEIILFVCLFFCMGMILMTSISSLKNAIESIKSYDKINHYKYIRTSNPNFYLYLNQLNDYITNEEKDGYTVYMIVPDAVVYMIPGDRCHRNYDLCLKGNTGKYTEEDLINDLKSKKKLKVLVYTDSIQDNWQCFTELKKYITNKMEYIDTFGIYDIYEK